MDVKRSNKLRLVGFGLMLIFFVIGGVAAQAYKETNAEWLEPIMPLLGGLMFTVAPLLSYDAWRFQSQKPMHKDERIMMAVYYFVGALFAIGLAPWCYNWAWQVWTQ